MTQRQRQTAIKTKGDREKREMVGARGREREREGLRERDGWSEGSREREREGLRERERERERENERKEVVTACLHFKLSFSVRFVIRDLIRTRFSGSKLPLFISRVITHSGRLWTFSCIVWRLLLYDISSRCHNRNMASSCFH